MGELTFVFGVDGNQDCVHIQGRDNLAEDPVGFGDNPKEALENLLEQLGPNLD